MTGRREPLLDPVRSGVPSSAQASAFGAPLELVGLDLVAYWRVIRRNLPQILGLALAVGLLAGLFAYSLEPVYEASATLLVDTNRRGFSPVQEDPVGGWYTYLSSQSYLQTQVLLLDSRALAEDVAERLELWTHPELDPRVEAPSRARFQLDLGSLLPGWIRGDHGEAPRIPDEKAREAVVSALVAGVRAEVVPESEIVKVSFAAHDPELAARVVGGYADAYVELGLETRLETVRKAAGWLTQRLEGLREQVESSERELQRYREEHGILDMDGALDLTDQQLAELSQRLVEARAQLDGLRSEYQQVLKLQGLSSAELAAHPVVVRNPIIQTLKTEEVRAEREASELGERYGAQHPKMVAARSDLNTIRAKLRAEIGSTIAGAKKELDIAQSRVDQLEAELEQQKKRAQEVNREEFKLRALKRDVETNRQLYDMFLTRLKETDLGTDVESTNARVVDAAQVPTSPIKPRKERIIAVAVFLAVLLGIGLAFLREHLDSTLKSSDDVEDSVQLATLGSVPLLRTRGRKRVPAERVFLDDPKSEFAEAIRTIRTGIVLSGLDDPHRVILVTSTVPGEGKTTIATNLASALAQLERVLLVDGDLRRASIGKKLGLDGARPGLSDLVAGTATLEDCVQRIEDTQLSVIPAGMLPPNPLDLLSSQAFRRLLDQLRGRYDRIVLDSAPAQAVSDALVLSRLCDAVVFVLKADATPSQLVQLAVKRLRQVDAPFVGAVLNQYDHLKATRYGHHPYGKYGDYGYAYQGYTQYGRETDKPR